MKTAKIVLAGSPNVGKSTVFNALTGMRQHTGNWSGKTVETAEGKFVYGGKEIRLVDLPGTYSLVTDSAEEEAARDFLCFEEFDGAVVVCDACSLERNLIFAMQVAQLVPNTVLCVNMMDDARKKGVEIDIAALSEETGLPAIGISAAVKEGLPELEKMISELAEGRLSANFVPVRYPKELQRAAENVLPVLNGKYGAGGMFAVLRLLEKEAGFTAAFEKHWGKICSDKDLSTALDKAGTELLEEGFSTEKIAEKAALCTAFRAEEICLSAVRQSGCTGLRDEKIDAVLTGRKTGFLVMILLFAFVFWLTVSGANYPSQLLFRAFEWSENGINTLLSSVGCGAVLKSLLVDGVWKVLGWVVSVMLPPMAIFFPLFTILEDVGYLPRVAFNLDKGFQKSNACGKQALTMCMGLGCGAVGVTGARIIDSPRERLIAIITNSFMPCNGRLPAIIALITMFFTGSKAAGALVLTGAMCISVLVTLVVSKILSKTVLKGVPASFTLELPPYRMPKIGKVIVRSAVDRTAKILGRAVIVAVPAGVAIWLCSYFTVGGRTLLENMAAVLDPFAKIFGLDGNILCGFILSLPANEIALPIMAMGYGGGGLSELENLSETAKVFAENGFTFSKALCTMAFFLFHWPCATTIITIWKETKSLRWTLLSVAVPFMTGFLICFAINIAAKLFI